MKCWLSEALLYLKPENATENYAVRTWYVNTFKNSDNVPVVIVSVAFDMDGEALDVCAIRG